MRKPLLILAVILLAVSLVVAHKVLHHQRYLRGEEMPTAAVLAADPLLHAAAIPKVPTLLIFDNRDVVVDPALNEFPMQSALGKDCAVRSYSGTAHFDPRLYSPAPIFAFIKSHAPEGTPVFLLHGSTGGVHTWDIDKTPEVHAALVAAINLQFPATGGDFGGQGWGNDASVSSLEKAAAGKSHIILIGESMGAALMWRYSEKHPSQVVAMIGISPVCSLTSLCHHSRHALPIIEAYSW